MRPTRYLRFTARSLATRARGRRTAHFLHIGKSAGTAMKHALGECPEPTRYRVVVHTHGVRMTDVPWRDKFFFVVRDPIDRFVSGFDSRLRKGEPRFSIAWTEAEARAFAAFPTASELGLALAADGSRRAAAEAAMRSIGHVNTSYWDWFRDRDAIGRRARDILWIGFVEGLDAQMAELAELLGVPALVLPSDSVAAHRSTNDAKPELAAQAREALAEWYRKDYEFLELCHELNARRAVS